MIEKGKLSKMILANSSLTYISVKRHVLLLLEKNLHTLEKHDMTMFLIGA